ncbi:DUF2339 domain-containing protein [Aliagarivorans marinus]|uniref:DUF2339 domain-containing protein n=1 Tax=Aliagarivorans marinus TaxID=561965 RepID=UPI00042259CE|nr:DUF2339 domain-containing protein [Aliagarivorans marinus]
MEIVVMIGLAVLVLPIIAIVMASNAGSSIRSLKQRQVQLEQQVEALQRQISQQRAAPVAEQSDSLSEPEAVPASTITEPPPVVPVAETGSAVPESLAQSATESQQAASPTKAIDKSQLEPEPASAWATPTESPIIQHLKRFWMAWSGGLCVALAGIFMVRYSIEEGLLSPAARVSIGAAMGLLLHGVAIKLRQRTLPDVPVALGALAGGASLCIFASVLSAQHLYHLIPEWLSFTLLAVTAVATMWLALFYGPPLAGLGILGAYLVPLVLGASESNWPMAFGYSLLVSISALGVLRYVFRDWLWYGALAGALLWFGLSIVDAANTPTLVLLQSTYLAVLGYLLLAFPSGDWALTQVLRYPDKRFPYKAALLRLVKPGREPREIQAFSFGLLVLAQCLSLLTVSLSSPASWSWLPLMALLLWASSRQERLSYYPWLYLIGLLAILLARQFDVDSLSMLPLAQAGLSTWHYSGLALAALVFAAAGYSLKHCRAKALWASLAFFSTPLLLLSGYLLRPNLSTSLWAGNMPWVVITLLVGLLNFALLSRVAGRREWRSLAISVSLAGHFCYALSVSWLLDSTGLTFALSLQLWALAATIKRFRLPQLAWAYKVLLTLVVGRLSLHPLLFELDKQSLWLLLNGFAATALCVLAGKQLGRYQQLKAWSEGAMIHLLTLSLWAALRYLLHNGDLFQRSYSATEASLNMLLFGALALVYQYRSHLAGKLRRYYQGYAVVLLVAAAANYTLLLMALTYNLPWLWQNVGSWPLFNLSTLSFATPALLLALGGQLHRPWRNYCWYAAAATIWLWLNIALHHLWQGSVRWDLPISSAEVYSFSLMWLLLAIAAILLGHRYQLKAVYQFGLAQLLLTIGKLFLVDMEGLTGLLRVASFLGMGLSLLGLSYLHKQLVGSAKQESD